MYFSRHISHPSLQGWVLLLHLDLLPPLLLLALLPHCNHFSHHFRLPLPLAKAQPLHMCMLMPLLPLLLQHSHFLHPSMLALPLLPHYSHSLYPFKLTLLLLLLLLLPPPLLLPLLLPLLMLMPLPLPLPLLTLLTLLILPLPLPLKKL